MPPWPCATETMTNSRPRASCLTTPVSPGRRWTRRFAAQHDHPFDILGHEGDLFGLAEYQLVGSRTVDPANSLTLGSYDLVNLRVGWDSDRVSVYGFVDNLLDETYAESAFAFGASPAGDTVHAAIPSQPRRFGVGVRLRF